MNKDSVNLSLIQDEDSVKDWNLKLYNIQEIWADSIMC
jgi:hypothetical protein